MYPESDDLREYLVSDTIVDWQTPAVRQKALELTQSLLERKRGQVLKNHFGVI
jgi:hypothetical protein